MGDFLNYLISDERFFGGIIIGIIGWNIYRFYMSSYNTMNIKLAVEQANQILSLYSSSGIDETCKYISDNQEKLNSLKLWRKCKYTGYTSYRIWCVLLIFVAYKCASYNYSDSLENIIDNFAKDFFTQNSFAYQTLKANITVIDSATVYYTSNIGWAKNESEIVSHGGIKDYSNPKLYDLVYLMINSVRETSFQK